MTNLGALLSTVPIPKDAQRLAAGREYGYRYTPGRDSNFQNFYSWSVINGRDGDVALNITPKGKSDGIARLLIWGWASFYSSAGNCGMELGVWVDGGFTQIGLTTTNFGEHLCVSGVHTVSVSAGISHLIQLGAHDANVVMQFDYNDGAGLLVVEH